MSPFRSDALIRPASDAERVALLQMLLPGLADAPLQSALASLANGATLLAAVRNEELVGGIYLQPQEGGLTFVTGPKVAESEPEETLDLLLISAIRSFDSREPSLLQALTDSNASPETRALQTAGFEEVAALLYLVSLRESFPREEPRGDFGLEPYTDQDHDRLAALLERTYIDTHDFAALEDDRPVADSIRGYRSTGESADRYWRFLRHKGTDCGCLLLGDFPEFQQLELIYFGLAPEARGKGLGRQLVRWAQWLAGSLGRERLVLAVDEVNAPAIRIYADCGFQVWQRRHVWLRKS